MAQDGKDEIPFNFDRYTSHGPVCTVHIQKYTEGLTLKLAKNTE